MLDGARAFIFNACPVDPLKKEIPAYDPLHPRHRRKLWVRFRTKERVFYHVYWRRVAVVLAVLAVMAWLGLAGAAWAFVKYRRGFDGVSYFNIAFYPLRAEHHRRGLGQHYLALGNAEIEKKNYAEGYALLVAGLARVPEDIAARRQVATTQLRFGQVDRAIRTLVEGAEGARGDLDYLKLLFGLLLERHEDEQVVALATKLLPSPPDGRREHQFIALQAATAHSHRGRPDAAEQLVAAWRLEASLEGQILLARNEWDSGHTQLALQRLEAQIPRFPQRDELYLELVRLNRELGRPDEARRHALLRQFNDAASPGPRIDLLHTYRASGDKAAEQRELDAYLATFSDVRSLLLLAWFAVDTAQPDLAQRVFELARTNRLPLPAFVLARVQTALATQDYRTALAAADAELEAKTAEAPAADYALVLLQGLRAVAVLGLGDRTRSEALLAQFLATARLRAGDALLLARQYRLLGAPEPARRILERACALDPLNQPALAELVRLDTEAGNRAGLLENVPKLLRMRRPARGVLEETLLRLNEPGDAALRTQISETLARLGTAPPL